MSPASGPSTSVRSQPHRRLVAIAGAAAAVAALPHAVYHSRHRDTVGSTFDQVLSIGGLWFNVAVGVAVVAGATGRRRLG